MLIALLADIHANLPALAAVLADTRRRGCERICHAGDLIAIGPYPAEVVDIVRAHGVACVQGNHEQWLECGLPTDPTPLLKDDEELMHQHWTHSRLDKPRRDFLRSLPYRIDETIEGVRLVVEHFALEADGKTFRSVNWRGSDEEILNVFTEPAGTLVCFGHLHNRRFNLEYQGRHFLMPGTVGCGHDSNATYATVDIRAGGFHVEECSVPYDRDSVLRRYDELEVPARDTVRRIFFGVRP